MVIRSVLIDISIGKNLSIPQSYIPLVWFILAIVILAAATLSMFIFSQPKVLGQRILRWITRKGDYNDFSCTLQQTFSGHTDFIWNIKWSPDGKWLASSSLDNTICLWETEKSSPTHILRDHMAVVWSLEWSPNGELLASGSLDGSVYLWEAQTGTLRYAFSDSKDQITSLSWSPDGQALAFSSLDGSIYLLSIQTEELRRVFFDRMNIIGCLVWSPDGNTIASTLNNKVQLLNAETGQTHEAFVDHANQITCIAWSPDGKTLAMGFLNNEVRFLNIETGQAHQRLVSRANQITCITWSPDGKILATGSSDTTVRLWDLETGLQTNILEGHIDAIRSLSFSADGRFLTSFSQQDLPYARGNFRIWHSGSWNLLYNVRNLKGVAPAIFHPKTMTLATISQEQTSINIWNVNISSSPSIGEASQLEETIHYRNAKVVLVGDSGVGKTGLGLVLTGKTFVPTESTHGRYVWPFDKREVFSNTQNKEMREILLWDLAGQPGYRLFHQLHLNDTVVALVVFDSRNETDPFAGVRYWDRALQQACYGQGNMPHPLRKVLVAARVDRGGISASTDRIQSFVEELHFQRYFETSAKEPLNIEELKAFIEQAIDWDQLPRISSTYLFQKIKDFFLAQKKNRQGKSAD